MCLHSVVPILLNLGIGSLDVAGHSQTGIPHRMAVLVLVWTCSAGVCACAMYGTGGQNSAATHIDIADEYTK